MGGFLFWKTNDQADSGPPLNLQRAKAVMKAAGVQPGALLGGADFQLQIYDKSHWPVANVLELPGGDFIAGTGTLFYRRRMGREALDALYRDFTAGVPVEPHLHGHFAVFIHHKGQLTLFNDYNGLYHLFSLPGERFLSSSFLAASAASPSLTRCDNAIFEYLIYGAFHGAETLFNEVRCLDSRMLRQLSGKTGSTPRRAEFPPAWANTADREEIIASVCAGLEDCFSLYVEQFGDAICSALSGGFDSRLMLATFRKLGIVPKLYVYGSAESKDVTIATRICQGERLPLDAIDRAKLQPAISPAHYPGAFRRQFYSIDSRSLLGAADDGGDILTRTRRLEQARLHLNGAGGEIYRDYWQLPDFSMSRRAFVSRTYWRSYIPYYFPCTAKFRQEPFFASTVEKMADAAGAGAGGWSDRLQRWQMEAVYPYYRLRDCMNLCYYPNNLMAESLTPFIEPALTQPSHLIPIRFKRHANFQMAVLRRLDPALAAYPSQGGFDFSTDAKPRQRVRNWKAILNRHYLKAALPIPFLTKLYRRRIVRESFPYYLGEAFTAELTGGLHAVLEYIDPALVWDAAQMNRVVTLEFILTQFACGID
jgi:asparagine synthase (glutamine-hydrolysing)